MRAFARMLCLAVMLVPLLAGCTNPPAHPPLQARLETRQVPESTLYPGLIVRGTLGDHGEGIAISAVARNEGSKTYKVETTCSTPWKEVLFLGNDTVTMRRPATQCDMFALTEFEPGDELTFDAAWDGRVWDDAQQRLVSAEPGNYTWSVRFVAYQSDGINLRRFDLDFEVTVLPS